MNEPVDNEIEAIKVILTALTALSEKARASVLDYVTRRLDLVPILPTSRSVGASLPPATPPQATLELTHIKTFKEQKNPRSANEMAALVAYYFENVVPANQRKATINQKDIETQFKIADFPLPKSVRLTLTNAKNSGYFDMAGDGEYKLNAVGHNLVAHSMPRGSGPSTRRARRGKRKKAASGKSKK